MNNKLFYFFYNFAHSSPVLDSVIIFFAKTFPYFVILGAMVFVLFHHKVHKSEDPLAELIQKWKEILFVFFASAIAWASSVLLKLLIHSPRPFNTLSDVRSLFVETGYGFPSGHATFFSALAVSIFLIDKKYGYIFIASALLIGIARIMGGVHFPLDILGGFVLGTAIAYFVKKYRIPLQLCGKKT